MTIPKRARIVLADVAVDGSDGWEMAVSVETRGMLPCPERALMVRFSRPDGDACGHNEKTVAVPIAMVRAALAMDAEWSEEQD